VSKQPPERVKTKQTYLQADIKQHSTNSAENSLDKILKDGYPHAGLSGGWGPGPGFIKNQEQ
jgi:hypothetical protein